jgi:serine kinase of HPr protein (carbohydrate metabolism regulator)
MSAAPGRTNVHGTGVVVGGIGLLLRGASGAGKSLLALELLERQALLGKPGSLVADDRIDLAVEEGSLVMHAPANIAGLIELRGRGIVARPFLTQAPLHLVVDLVDELVRMVEEDALETDLLGVPLKRCPVPRRGVVDANHQLLLIGEALAQFQPAQPDRRQKFT